VHDLFTEAIWPNHPLGRTIVGVADTVREMRRPDILKYMARFYGPANTVIAVAGNVKAPDIVAKVEKAFGAWQSGHAPADIAEIEPPVPATGLVLRPKDTEQIHLCLGAPGVAQDEPD